MIVGLIVWKRPTNLQDKAEKQFHMKHKKGIGFKNTNALINVYFTITLLSEVCGLALEELFTFSS